MPKKRWFGDLRSPERLNKVGTDVLLARAIVESPKYKVYWTVVLYLQGLSQFMYAHDVLR